jgi:SAM-dependent MidA family methyltransferase
MIIERIRREGPITFRDFMEMSLYYPGLGYYSSDRLPIGKKGDFYTSPHLHPVFGAVIAKVMVEMWDLMGRPDAFHIIEAGAGAGHLCRDILDYLSKSNNMFLSALRYIIVEINPFFRKTQKALLRDYGERIQWVKGTGVIKEPLVGCVLSNELLDSFPVHLVVMEDKLWEIYVDARDNNFIEIKQDVSTNYIIEYFNQFNIEPPHNYRTEVNLMIRDWLREMEGILREGFLITIDYGYTAEEYYSEDRYRGTLLCYYQHRVNENPYEHTGEQDITAHVNFSSLHRWGMEYGFNTIGYCPQGVFLIASGIDEIIEELYADSPEYQFIVAGLKGLILPQGMGETHKVMIQYKGEGRPELKGFSLRNQIKNL